MKLKIKQITLIPFILFFNLLPPSVSVAQNYAESVKEYREHYREKFLNGSKLKSK